MFLKKKYLRAQHTGTQTKFVYAFRIDIYLSNLTFFVFSFEIKS